MFTCVAIRCIPIGTTRLRLGGVMSNLFFSRPQQSGRHATHGWLVKFLEHRIADRRVVRLIQKWLNAGVLEDGTRTWSETGTPQRVQCIAPAGECLSALCVRPLGPAVAADAGSRRGHRRALCGRLRHDTGDADAERFGLEPPFWTAQFDFNPQARKDSCCSRCRQPLRRNVVTGSSTSCPRVALCAFVGSLWSA